MGNTILYFFDPATILWLKKSIVIFFLTFIHEDAAILAAGISLSILASFQGIF
jgi:hypothetical protein